MGMGTQRWRWCCVSDLVKLDVIVLPHLEVILSHHLTFAAVTGPIMGTAIVDSSSFLNLVLALMSLTAIYPFMDLLLLQYHRFQKRTRLRRRTATAADHVY